jgi:hypothetical protein
MQQMVGEYGARVRPGIGFNRSLRWTIAAVAVVANAGCVRASHIGSSALEPARTITSVAGSISQNAAISGQLATATIQSPPATAAGLDSYGASDSTWTIEAGSYAGTRVPLHIAAAIGKGGREHFWRLSSSEKDAGVVGWRTTSYPVPVAFRRTPSVEISAEDSIAFWGIIAEMNTDFGMTLFRPVTVARGDPEDVIIVDLKFMRDYDGVSRATWSSTGELFDVRVTFHDASVLHERRVVVHEMMHALGFGHTTTWTSVLNPGNPSRALNLTPADVAHAELAMRSREKSERATMRRLIALAVERESPSVGVSDGNSSCGGDEDNSLEAGVEMRLGGFVSFALLTVVPGCAPAKR